MSRRVKVSPLQRPMLDIDDSDNVTYYVNGFAQTFEELRDYEPDFEEIDLNNLESDVLLMSYFESVAVEHSSVEKEDNRTVQLSITDLEKIKKILTAIPQFRELAAERGQDVESIEFLAQAVTEIDFMSLPHFDLDMSIFDLLPKNNPEYREFIFSNILTLVNQVGLTHKFPTRKYLKSIFIDFTPDQIEIVYQLLKRFLSLFNAWGGILIHLFEQTIRDWLYIVYERGSSLNQEQILEYLKLKYPCKPLYELNYLAQMLFNSISFSRNLDDFVSEFIGLMYCFIPEQNIFITPEETFRLWTSEFLRNRVKQAAEKWMARIATSSIVTPNSELDSYFGVTNRLSKGVREGVFPAEACAPDSINESIIKLKLYFPQGHRTLIEARIDRMTRSSGVVSIFDWKTTRKDLEGMNDFEKLQIILQCVAVKNMIGKSSEGAAYVPMENKDYKFFLTSTGVQWLDTTNLPQFFHIPENTDQVYEYIAQSIPPEEADRLLAGFSSVVNFIINNKKALAKVRKHLKNLDSFIQAPKLVAPVVQIETTYFTQPAEA